MHALAAGARGVPLAGARAAGERLGDLARALGLRARVARANLALAFPERAESERERWLVGHYRELGRTVMEYPRMPELARAPREEIFARFDGLEIAEEASARGRGVVFVTGHCANFELAGAAVGQVHPLDFVAKPMQNPGVERWVRGLRERSGVGLVPVGGGFRRVFQALRQRRWVAMLADQDARRHGVFVPFFGRLASTASGPARVSLATGAPIVFGVAGRALDDRPTVRLGPVLWPEGDARDEAAVTALTARHAALLECAIREAPERWFWLHRRWKTAPPSET